MWNRSGAPNHPLRRVVGGVIISLAIITGAAAQPVFDLYPDTVLTALGDTLYLGGLQAIAYSDRYGYAFLDSDVGGLVLTDLQFRPIQRLGRFGGGPQEYPSATLLRFWGDTLVVGRRLFRLPAFEYLGQLPVSPLAIAPHALDLRTDSLFLRARRSPQSPLQLVRPRERPLNFGRQLYQDRDNSWVFNLRVGVFFTEWDELLSVFMLFPQVERYRLDGTLREVLELDHFRPIAQLARQALRQTETAHRKGQPFMIYSLWEDAVYKQGWLYLAPARPWPGLSRDVTVIIVVRVTPEGMRLSHLLRLHRNEKALQAELPPDWLQQWFRVGYFEVIAETNKLLAWMNPDDLLYVYTLPELP
ncbi:hypothetical protein [Rhodothermus profundi]|uniref:6-bladed beta-propeller protein n=1 Tax=Rhodothermus profundi TaxID=633813 RepID=A0A1M6PG42_9BACT|nr:hypothetical protein [Rhodothermus profundi]SHK06918.1 hypothetical protein SAMN04488087_0171 [Rhodothermus profundi]